LHQFTSGAPYNYLPQKRKQNCVVRLSKNQYKSTLHSPFLYVKKKLKMNINIASIFITLTEINNEAHYVAKKNPKTKNKKSRTTNISLHMKSQHEYT
jgi:hypothetical protein